MINKIIVVGGGTAGCISALMLKTKFPQIEINLLESENVGIVGVGESSTEHWSRFCDFIGITKLDTILHCNSTFKSGVYFENWSEKDFVHSISSPMNKKYGDYYGMYAHLISSGCSPKEICDPKSYTNEVDTKNFSDYNYLPYEQFHFDTFSLNEFLHKECEKRNILIIKGDVIEVAIREDSHNIHSVVTKDAEHCADFFLDCTGFSRLLLNKVYGIGWKSYSEYLPVNSAIAFATKEMDEYNKYTKSTARNAGWSWTIPTQTRTGNGYVYCDSFIGKDEAHREMEKAYGQSLDITKEFKFDPGRLEKSWHKNCYAVGLSQSFVEPLEATSIGSIIQQMFCFIHYLPSYDHETCNEHVNEIFDNIVDYVQAHYLIKREDTPFWKEVKYNLKLTPNLEKYLKKWKNRLPLAADVLCRWGLFESVNYIPILYGLGWFDVEKIKEEYVNFHEFVISKDVMNQLKERNSPFSSPMSHKKFIKEIIRGKK